MAISLQRRSCIKNPDVKKPERNVSFSFPDGEPKKNVAVNSYELLGHLLSWHDTAQKPLCIFPEEGSRKQKKTNKHVTDAVDEARDLYSKKKIRSADFALSAEKITSKLRTVTEKISDETATEDQLLLKRVKVGLEMVIERKLSSLNTYQEAMTKRHLLGL